MTDERLRRWIFDVSERLSDVYERFPNKLTEQLWEWYPDNFLQGLVCRVVGHSPTRDMCGIPEHDYCGWCQTSTPNGYKMETK